MMGIRKPIQRNNLLQGLQSPPILQFPCFVAIVVSLQLGSISWRLIGIVSMLNSPNYHQAVNRCSYFWSDILS
jgi:hypothetical protein